jgi:hypothetical protein
MKQRQEIATKSLGQPECVIEVAVSLNQTNTGHVHQHEVTDLGTCGTLLRHSASRPVCTFSARLWPPFTVEKRLPAYIFFYRDLFEAILCTPFNLSQRIPSAFPSHFYTEVDSILNCRKTKSKSRIRRNRIKHFPTYGTISRPSRTMNSSLPPIMTSPLFNLPFEIRHKIYQHVFRGSALDNRTSRRSRRVCQMWYSSS